MKKILCYGDSNTFGMVAETLERYSETERWSGVLTQLLKNKYDVIEEGLPDRNAFIKNVKGSEYCAIENLPVCLKQNSNIDIIILALGTNDLQFAYEYNEKIVTDGLSKLINIIKEYENSAKIIVVPPVKIDKYVSSGYFNFQFNDLSVERIENTFDIYKQIADKTNCYYFDFNEIVRPSNKDGLHYEVPGHKLIAENLAKYILSIAV